MLALFRFFQTHKFLHYLYKKAPYNSFYCYIEPLPFFYFSVSLDTIAGIRIVTIVPSPSFDHI